MISPLDAVGAFAATNVDDFLLLLALFAAPQAHSARGAARIWAGQYIGVGVIVVVSMAGAWAARDIPLAWAGLLGLVPIGVGVRALLQWRAAVRAARGATPAHGPGRAGRTPGGPDAGSALAVAFLTAANGGDNVSVYIPLFRAAGPAGTTGAVVVFAVLVAVWCAAASWISRRPAASSWAGRVGPRFVPILYIVLGAVVVVRSLAG